MWRAVERWGSQIKSGLNFDFLSRLFGKSKSYAQFESTEDIFSDAKEELVESEEEDDVILMRNSDPYEVTYERRRTKVKGYGASSEYDVQIHSDSSGNSNTGLRDHCNGDAQVDGVDRSQKSTARLGAGHRRQGSSVREEVGELVTSVFQRQYNKFENDSSDEDHSSRDQGHNSVCDSAKEQDSNSNVFHSIKDVDPTWKAKKPKRRKKIAKRTRRMVRGTWKWLRRGMSDYAKAFNTPTFFIINVSGSAVNKKSNLKCYTRVVAHYPYVVLAAVLLVSVTCLIVTVVIGDAPSFEDPLAGFEPRGTELSNRLIAYNNLISDSTVSQLTSDHTAVIQDIDQLVYHEAVENGSQGSRQEKRSNPSSGRKRQFFCDVPDSQWAKVVYNLAHGEDLFTVTNIKNMCQLENAYISSKRIYQKYCGKGPNGQKCCRPLSLGNYVALLTDKDSCANVTQEDVKWVKQLLEECSGFYYNFSLTDSCDKRHSPFYEREKCKGVPKRCVQYNAIYNLIHYILDHTFIQKTKNLRHAISFLPVTFLTGSSEKLNNAISLYTHIEQNIKAVGNVEIIAIDFGIKNQLFQFYLEQDSKWLIIGTVAIFIVVWVVTSSIFITVMTFLAMFWSLELAYFLYIFVFEVPFFPYMNLVTVLLILALGSDDVFVYTKIWHLAKRDRNSGTLEKLVSDTLKHATLSMFVTSLTTAGALLANIVSPITTLKCFSVYAGTAVLCNLVFMVTWTPAIIVIQEKWCDCCCVSSPKIYKIFRAHYRHFFERLLPHFVLRLRYMWIILFGGLGVCCGILVFHYPKLRLPTSFKFQVFRHEHLMERYDQELKENFWFEKSVRENKPYLPLTFVWGAMATDTGSQYDPYDRGILELDPDFNPGTPHAQVWLRHFCQQLRRTEFYKKVEFIEYNNCFIEHFSLYMKSPCINGETICCNQRSFPYRENVFKTCIKKYIAVGQNTYFGDRYTPGIRFVNNELKALIVQFSSNFIHAEKYEEAKLFYERVNDWFMDQLLTAPTEIQNGWFISEFRYFSLQASLARGMPIAFGISLLVAMVVTFFTSLNALITLYAIISIGCIMLVTVGAIVLLGWELNVLESVIITVAVGLSIDHTLHYGVAYRLAPDLDRHNRALSSLKTVGSVICMASITTFLAGVFMLASVTLVYQKFGIFLILVISISWLYSTLFFQSLLNVMGPQGGFGQFHWPTLDCCNVYPRNHVDRTTYSVSESTMSSLSSGYPHRTSVDIEKDMDSERVSLDSPHPRSRQCRQWRGGSTQTESQTNEVLLNGDDGKTTDVSDNKPAQKCTEV